VAVAGDKAGEEGQELIPWWAMPRGFQMKVGE